MELPFERILKVPGKTFLLLGPRGTGKSTWLKSVMRPAVSIDLLQQRQYLEYASDPSKLIEICKPLKKNDWVIIDEIQKIPALMDEVHSLYESHRIHFALTGSSARKLKRGGANLMAGRALQRFLFPFTYPEFKNAWTLDQALVHGSLPLIVSNPGDAEERLISYVNTYLKEELMEEGLIRKLEPFARFLKMTGAYNAQILNVENIAREAAVKRPTVDQYLEVLTDTLIATRIEALKLGHHSRETRHPKLYFFDSGVARACSLIQADDFDSVLQGFSFESFMVNEMRAYLSYALKHYPLYHYSISGSYDIDLIVETRPKSISKPRKLILIEFKNSKRLDARWADGVFDLAKTKKAEIEKKIVVYRGKEVSEKHGVDFMPAEFFLERLHAGRIC